MDVAIPDILFNFFNVETRFIGKMYVLYLKRVANLEKKEIAAHST
jgi:hypothetical protein